MWTLLPRQTSPVFFHQLTENVKGPEIKLVWPRVGKGLVVLALCPSYACLKIQVGISPFVSIIWMHIEALKSRFHRAVQLSLVRDHKSGLFWATPSEDPLMLKSQRIPWQSGGLLYNLLFVNSRTYPHTHTHTHTHFSIEKHCITISLALAARWRQTVSY